jgi:outer membrane immunogenic protein
MGRLLWPRLCLQSVDIPFAGKIGYAWDRVLLYAKGGGAWVATTSPSISIAGGRPASFSAFNNTTTSTWTVGFGLEWAFSGNWSARAEYDYIAVPNIRA